MGCGMRWKLRGLTLWIMRPRQPYLTREVGVIKDMIQIYIIHVSQDRPIQNQCKSCAPCHYCSVLFVLVVDMEVIPEPNFVSDHIQ